jgi:hypothetical protein
MIRRSRLSTCLAAFLLLLALPMAVGLASAKADKNNAGTIKVHDDATADPEVRNEPHVSCDFWIEGFNMQDSSGSLVFRAWPPTGHKQVVTPTGDGLSWSADAGNKHGNYHFLNGAYQLPEGHYKVTAVNEGGEKTKSKVFWVDPCKPECTQDCVPCVVDCQPPPCTHDCTPPPCSENCVPTPPTKVPFFPSAGSLVLGLLGAAGSVGAVILKRRG